MIRSTFIAIMFIYIIVCLMMNGCSKKETLEDKLSTYSQLIKEHPDNSWLYRERGLIYYHMDKLKSAQKDFDKAIELGVRDVEVYRCRANLLMATSRYDLAINDLTNAVAISNGNSYLQSWLLTFRGDCRRSLRQYRLAINC